MSSTLHGERSSRGDSVWFTDVKILEIHNSLYGDTERAWRGAGNERDRHRGGGGGKMIEGWGGGERQRHTVSQRGRGQKKRGCERQSWGVGGRHREKESEREGEKEGETRRDDRDRDGDRVRERESVCVTV